MSLKDLTTTPEGTRSSERYKKWTPDFLMHRVATMFDPARWADFLAESVTLDAWQAELMSETERSAIVCACAGAGKTALAALLAAHQTLYRPGHVTTIVSPLPAARTAVMRQTRGILKAVVANPFDVDVAAMVKLSNGSSLHSLHASNGMIGLKDSDLVLVDDAIDIKSSFWPTIRRMVSVTHGRLVLLTQAGEPSGFVHDAMSDTESDWLQMSVPYHHIDRIDPEHIRQEQRLLPPWQFSRMYECLWLEEDPGQRPPGARKAPQGVRTGKGPPVGAGTPRSRPKGL